MYQKQPPTLTAREGAINLLSRRDHSRYELIQKLTQKGYEEADISEAVKFCEDHRYLDDLRYARSAIRTGIAKGYGKLRITMELNQKKVSESEINLAFDEESTDWFELAKQAAEKKFRGKQASDQKEYAKQVRFLQYRGFDFEQIKYALSGDSDEE